jgi:hypothetical protein
MKPSTPFFGIRHHIENLMFYFSSVSYYYSYSLLAVIMMMSLVLATTGFVIAIRLSS